MTKSLQVIADEGEKASMPEAQKASVLQALQQLDLANHALQEEVTTTASELARTQTEMSKLRGAGDGMVCGCQICGPPFLHGLDGLTFTPCRSPMCMLRRLARALRSSDSRSSACKSRQRTHMHAKLLAHTLVQTSCALVGRALGGRARVVSSPRTLLTAAPLTVCFQDEERSARVLAVLESKDSEIGRLQDVVRALERAGTAHAEETRQSDERARRASEQLDAMLAYSRQLESEVAAERAQSEEQSHKLIERDTQVTELETQLREHASELKSSRLARTHAEREAAAAAKQLEECQLSLAHLQAERQTRGAALHDLEARELRLHALLESTVAMERATNGAAHEYSQRNKGCVSQAEVCAPPAMPVYTCGARAVPCLYSRAHLVVQRPSSFTGAQEPISQERGRRGASCTGRERSCRCKRTTANRGLYFGTRSATGRVSSAGQSASRARGVDRSERERARSRGC
jgi:hypothetical protein